jgi:DNA-binding NtrC family response regulator
MQRRVLVVDDDASVLDALALAVADDATEVTTASSAEQALGLVRDVDPHVVLTDVRMPGMTGLELLRVLRERLPDTEVVLMTAHDDLPLVASAVQAGAADFLLKPLDLHELRQLVARLCDDRTARIRAQAQRPSASARRLVGRDSRMLDIFKLIGRVAGTRTSVVIRGESGTGKELIARAIHDSSPYAPEPFVAVNCTALPSTLLESELFGHVRGAFTGATSDRRGRFAQAAKGTIFLDEIGDTSDEFQAKLLRVLQEREFYPVGSDRPERAEARVIAATHRDLERLVATGQFREDLYYRLKVVEITVPPLRDRLADLPQLAGHLVERASASTGAAVPALAPEAMELLMQHSWPGNVRELENTLTRAVIVATGGVIRPEHLVLGGSGLRAGSRVRRLTLEQAEREHIVAILESTGGHKSKTARILGVSRPRLDRLLKKHGIASGRQAGGAG